MAGISIKQFTGIEEEDKLIFRLLCDKYYVYLCVLSEYIVKNPEDAEEVVSDVFLKLWNLRNDIVFTTSIKSYLVKAVKNTSLNYVARDRTKKQVTEPLDLHEKGTILWSNDYSMGQLYEEEVLRIIEKGIESLPEGCREVFLLSRNEELKYKDIAAQLSISVNTVKSQMKIALSRLRTLLKDYLSGK